MPAHFAANDQLPGTNQINDAYHGTPAYHGSIFVDPATGAILRITLDAELNPSEPITRNAVSIDYGTVEMGGKNFICPVRSLAASVTRAYLPNQTGLRKMCIRDSRILSVQPSTPPGVNSNTVPEPR